MRKIILVFNGRVSKKFGSSEIFGKSTFILFLIKDTSVVKMQRRKIMKRWRKSLENI